ncbi:MAG: CoA pyrophosphatase [Bacteroidota bacterium]|nr:CoA pyrophosphatase [Bacteroidota bacterium]
MEFDRLIRELEGSMARTLPGQDAQYKMVPANRPRFPLDETIMKQSKRAAVAALFFPDEDRQSKLILIQRNTYEGVHSGQIGFPGGRLEPEDRGPMDAAARETEEELGIDRGLIDWKGALTPVYIPPSNFFVEPFVGVIPTPNGYRPDPREVQEVIEMPLERIQDQEVLRDVELDIRGTMIKVPAFVIDNRIIWGATAMMISELLHLFHSGK